MTKMSVLHLTGELPLEPAGQRPGADAGNPQLGLLEITSEAPTQIGVWECEPGGWPVDNRPTTEVAHIISGLAIITDEATKVAHSVTAGSLVVLPKGWSGRWDVVDTLRKAYVIY